MGVPIPTMPLPCYSLVARGPRGQILKSGLLLGVFCVVKPKTRGSLRPEPSSTVSSTYETRGPFCPTPTHPTQPGWAGLQEGRGRQLHPSTRTTMPKKHCQQMPPHLSTPSSTPTSTCSTQPPHSHNSLTLFASKSPLYLSAIWENRWLPVGLPLKQPQKGTP